MFSSHTPTRDTEFTAFVRSASASLTRTAYLITGDRELASELVQEAFVRTFLAGVTSDFAEGLTCAVADGRLGPTGQFVSMVRCTPPPSGEADATFTAAHYRDAAGNPVTVRPLSALDKGRCRVGVRVPAAGILLGGGFA